MKCPKCGGEYVDGGHGCPHCAHDAGRPRLVGLNGTVDAVHASGDGFDDILGKDVLELAGQLDAIDLTSELGAFDFDLASRDDSRKKSKAGTLPETVRASIKLKLAELDKVAFSDDAIGDSDFDPLAGLPGVSAPMPTSLIDEELADLTAMLFGEDYAKGTAAVGDDEDGLDFDVPVSVRKPESVRTARPEAHPEQDSDDGAKAETGGKGRVFGKARMLAKAAAEARKNQKSLKNNGNAAANGIAGSDTATSKDASGDDSLDIEVTPLIDRNGGPIESDADAPVAHASGKRTASDVFLGLSAALAAITAGGWMVLFAYTQMPDGDAIRAMSVTAFSVLVDLAFFGIGRRCGKGVWTCLFFISAAFLFIAVAATKAGQFYTVLPMAAVVFQFVSSGITYLKKKW